MSHRFDTLRVHELRAQPEERRWLVTDIWTEQAVGVIGGGPKSGKSLLALEMAVSVASGAPFLGRYECPRSGPVLFYAAEDALELVRHRIESLARAASLDLA